MSDILSRYEAAEGPGFNHEKIGYVLKSCDGYRYNVSDDLTLWSGYYPSRGCALAALKRHKRWEARIALEEINRLLSLLGEA